MNPTPPSPRRVRAPALALMAASGFAGLGYQIVWTQQSALWLGHESAAVLAVVGAFFGGLALGAFGLGARIERSARPAHWYAGCEAVIGAWSLVLAFVLPPVAAGLLELTGPQPSPPRQWLVAFAGTFVVLLPATAAMGATLPAMERVLARLADQGGNVAALYAGNTLGAVAGVLGSAFWLVPAFGLRSTAIACALLNLACAGLALQAFPARVAPLPVAQPVRRDGTLALLAATGLLGIGYEVLVVRVLSQVAENTVYTFAIVLAVYLAGTAAGAAAYARTLGPAAGRGPDPDRTRDLLLALLAVACALGATVLGLAPALKATALAALGPGMRAALLAEAGLATAAFLLPCLLMGALFSHLATRARAAAVGLGPVLGVNTLGASAAPFVFGVGLLPALGPKPALLGVAAGYLALSVRRLGPVRAAAATAATTGLALVGPSLQLVDLPEDGRLLSHRDGVLATVSVVEDADGVARLHINNRQQEGSSATRYADGRQALLPLLLHPAPRSALFLGLGTGATARAAATDPGLQVDVVELLPEVVEAAALFAPTGAAAAATPPRVLVADARRYVRASDRQYDVIVSDNFHPARSGSGSLYTVEHFRAVHGRLAPAGLFCQWLPLHQLDLPTLRSIVRAFVAAHPRAYAILATHSLDTPVLGLVAQRDHAGWEPGRLRERLAQAAALGPTGFGFDDELALLGSFVAGPQRLAAFAAGAPLNTDDRPVVAYLAPRITYAPDSLPRDRLLALLNELAPSPGEVLAPPPDAGWAARLAAYWSARNRYLEVGRDVRPSADPRRMLAQVRDPLLDVLRTSPEFRPAYDPLLRMAVALAPTDPSAARELLRALHAAQPARGEAAQALRDLGSAESEPDPTLRGPGRPAAGAGRP